MPALIAAGTERLTSATVSPCGRFRSTLERTWRRGSERRLLVVMFNASTADELNNDPTLDAVEALAQHNGFGVLCVMNGIPLRSSIPTRAVQWARTALAGRDLEGHKVMNDNLAELRQAAAGVDEILVAWGALGAHMPELFDRVHHVLATARRPGVRIVCLGRTAGGYPIHPLARGKHRVERTTAFTEWKPPANG